MKLLAILAVFLALPCMVHADMPVSANDQQFLIPQAKGQGVFDTYAKWTGDEVCRVESSASASLCYAGQAIVDGACYMGATANDYALVQDSNVISGITSTPTTAKLLSFVMGNPSTSATYGVDAGCQFFTVPLNAKTGIVAIASAARGYVMVYFRKMRK